MSVLARDETFDNRIACMAFAISHIVIINNKGEITTNLKNIIEICVWAMKVLENTIKIKPKILFALRD